MSDVKELPAKPFVGTPPYGADLDDLIFQGENWLASDR